MQQSVLVFGPLARATGKARIDVAANGPTCGEVRASIERAHPQATDLIRAARFAVNHEFVDDDHRIASTDEVALVVAVSGG